MGLDIAAKTRLHQILPPVFFAVLVVGAAYLLVFFITGALYYSSLNPHWVPHMGTDPKAGLLQGPALLVLPYIAGGMALALVYGRATMLSGAVVGLLASLAERVGIFALALPIYLAGGDGTMAGVSLHQMIKSEALSYFNELYVYFLWPVSIVAAGAGYLAIRLLSYKH